MRRRWLNLKKIAETIHGEVQKEIERIVGQYYFARSNGESFDLESFEIAIRSSMHGIGCKILEMFVNSDGGGYSDRTIPCENGHSYEFIEFRDKKLLTVLGSVTVKRAYYYDRDCRNGYCPKDRTLDIEGTSYSSGVRRMMSKVGAYRPFGLGHEDLYELADIRVSAKEVERISQMVGDQAEAFHAAEATASLPDNMIPISPVPKLYVCIDGTGVPVVKKETAGRKGKGEDGQAKTREAKLGCVFTQTCVDREGRPVRDDESTSYTGAIETAELFGRRIYQEAMRRGMDSAGETVVIGDGALGYGILRMNNFMEPPRLLISFMRGNITGMSPNHALGRTKTNCINGQKDAARNWMLADRKRLLTPSIVAHPCRDTIKRYVNGRSVILRRTRSGCDIRISGSAASL